jgi:hypothetical protein
LNRHDSHGDPAVEGLQTAASVSRRQWLQGVLALTAAGLTGSLTLEALAEDTGAQSLDTFMTLSQSLTGKSGLDHAVGGRLLAALEKSSPDLQQRLPQLAGALAAGSPGTRDQVLALRIMEGWYLGVVDNVVVTYEQALMFGVVSDTLVIRSYCPNKPGFWATKPIERRS